jgi:hypothetical protein
MRTIPPVLPALLLAFALAAPLPAQRRPFPRPSPTTFVGGSVLYAQPAGEFSDFVEDGFGAQAHFLWAPRRSPVGLRVDAGVLTYGSERFTVPLSPTVGGRIAVDLDTDNSIAFLGVGPQLGIPRGRFQPYVNGFVGVAYIFTQSSLEGVSDDREFARTTNFDDATFAFGGGGGIYIPLRRGSSPISLDLGVTYHNNGEADYLREGDIRDNFDGTITVFPVRSDTDLFSFQAGVTVGVGRGGDKGRDCRRHRGCDW